MPCVRSFVRYPQTPDITTSDRELSACALLRPIRKQRARPPQLLRLVSLNLATRDARAVIKNSA
jgi:hypothetical protein